MPLQILSIIRYNIRFVSKRMFLFLAWLIATVIFHAIYNNGYTHYTAIDVYLICIGMVTIEKLHVIQILIILLPYFGMAMMVDVYIAHMMGKHAIFSMLRIEKRLLFITSHVLSLCLIIFAMLFIYQMMLMISSFTLYDRTFPFTESLFTGMAIPLENIFLRLVLPALVGQFIGAFCVACVQLAVSIQFNRLSSGFMFVVILYFLQLVFPIIIGRHVFVASILIDYEKYIRFLITQLLVIGGCIIYLYVLSRKNILIFSERG